MPNANRLLVEQIIRQLNTRDPQMAALCHPDIEWHWPAATPGASLFRGHDELQRGLFSWAESWDELEMEPEELLEDGEYVLAMLRYRMRGAGSGVYLEEPRPTRRAARPCLPRALLRSRASA